MNKKELFKKNLADCLTSIQKFCRSRIFSEADAWDVCQKTLKILVEKKNEYDPNKDFKAWAMKICSFQIRKYFTEIKRTVKKRESLHNHVLTEDYLPPHPADQLLKKEAEEFKKHKIEILRKNLHPQERKLFNKMLEGVSRKEARQSLNMSVFNFNGTYRRTIIHSKQILSHLSSDGRAAHL